MLNKTSLRRTLLLLPVFAIVTATAGLGTGFFGTTQIPTTLADFFGPGTQPLGLMEDILPSADCQGCHSDYDYDSEPYRRWVSSMMGQAGRDPIFYACMTIANQDVADAGEMCLRCHAPGAWLAGRSTPTDGSALDPMEGDLDGVTCNFCHRLVDPVADPANPASDTAILAGLSSVTTNPHSGHYVVDPSDVRRGPFDLGMNFFWHSWEESPFHRESAMCGTCHDVSNPVYERVGNDYVLGTLGMPHTTHDKFDQFPIERTFSEWTQSDFAVRPIDMNNRFGGNKTEVASCQDCHMPDFSGSACAPALNGEFRDDLPQHDFNGANSWVLRAVRSLYPDSETGLTAQLVGFASARTHDMLYRATDIETFERGGDLVVRIVNHSGHKFPTGYGEGRRAWLNVKFFDGGDNLVGQHGKYQFGSATLTANDTKVYEVKQGLDAAASSATGIAAGESFHFAVNNTIVSDTRIPPRGFTNGAFAGVQADPVGYSYSEEQYWDDTVFTIPVGAVRANVFLNHQTTSKEYIEFLRDENTTNNTGQTAYDQWLLHGKSAPIGVDRAMIQFANLNCATPIPYGLSKVTSINTSPELTADDLPSVASGSLTLRVKNAVPYAYAIVISGPGSDSNVFNGGKRYVANPFTRIANFGMDVNGEGTVTLPLSPGMEGTRLNLQVVFRDSLSSFGLGLTNGLAVDVCE